MYQAVFCIATQNINHKTWHESNCKQNIITKIAFLIHRQHKHKKKEIDSNPKKQFGKS